MISTVTTSALTVLNSIRGHFPHWELNGTAVGSFGVDWPLGTLGTFPRCSRLEWGCLVNEQVGRLPTVRRGVFENGPGRRGQTTQRTFPANGPGVVGLGTKRRGSWRSGGPDQLMHLQLLFPSASFASLIQAASISCNTFCSSTVLADLTNRRHSSANLRYCAEGSMLKETVCSGAVFQKNKDRPHRNLLPETLTANYRIAADQWRPAFLTDMGAFR